MQNVGGDTLKLQERGDYAAFLKPVTLLYELYVLEGKIGKGLTDSERREALAKGMYGEKEMEWLTELNDTCRTYIDSRERHLTYINIIGYILLFIIHIRNISIIM